MSTLESMPPQLIGEPRETSQPSRIKDNAVHAGPSQLPDHWNQKMPSTDLDSETSLNNNWLIAHPVTEIWDAMEV